MHELDTLYDVCETLNRELEDANEKIRKAGGKLSAGDIPMIDTITHAIKSVKTTIAMIEAEGDYSNEYGNNFDSHPSKTYNYGYGMNNSWDDREMMRSQAQRRDGRGRYTREHESEINEIIAEMHELKNRVADPKTKRKIESMIRELRP